MDKIVSETEKHREREAVDVRLSIAPNELAAMKAATKVDASATAILAAARVGVEYLNSVKPRPNNPEVEREAV